MSDSEDGSFASADEGDASDTEPTTNESHASTKVTESANGTASAESQDLIESSTDYNETAELADSGLSLSALTVKETETLKLEGSQITEAVPDTGDDVVDKMPGSVSAVNDSDTSRQNTTVNQQASSEPAKDTHSGSFLQKFSGTATEKVSSWQNWGRSWGSSLISTAADSVSTLTSSVGEGLHTVVETMESGLGAPTPEQLLNDSMDESSQQDGGDSVVQSQPLTQPEVTFPQSDDTSPDTTGHPGHWLGSFWGQSGLASVTDAVQQTSKTLMTGGLDVLETIGKQTYNVLAEGDGGLKQVITRSRTGPDLSQTLREAKELSELRMAQDDQFNEARKANFGAQFDDFQGIVQLEALEILSSECETRLQSLLSVIPDSSDVIIRSELLAIKDTFHLDSDEDEEDDEDDEVTLEDIDGSLSEHFSRLGLSITPTKLIEVHRTIKEWLDDYKLTQNKSTSIRQGKEIHQKAIQVMAEMTATCVATYHRAAQLILLDKSTPYTLYRTKAATLSSITHVLSTEVGGLSRRFVSCLNLLVDNGEDSSLVSPLITDVYLEASNSQTYVKNAFTLLLPVLQCVSIEQFASSIK